jgi:hypothetical protein
MLVRSTQNVRALANTSEDTRCRFSALINFDQGFLLCRHPKKAKKKSVDAIHINDYRISQQNRQNQCQISTTAPLFISD